MSGDLPAYVHGHDASVLRSHGSRTVANSAQYLVPHLTAGLRILDVGCGPGSLTADLAAHCPQGSVTGIDASAEVIAVAAAAHGDVAEFLTGDIVALDFPDDHFDVVHAHQVLQHLRDPVAALTEIRRVTKPGGIVAARDADYAGMTWAPDEPRLDRWMALYQEITRRNGVEANAGLVPGDIHVDAVARYLYHIQDDGTAMPCSRSTSRIDLPAGTARLSAERASSTVKLLLVSIRRVLLKYSKCTVSSGHPRSAASPLARSSIGPGPQT